MKASLHYLNEVANSLVGVPYKHHGRDPTKGLDCFGMVIEFFKRLGIVIQDTDENYPEEWRQEDNFIGDYDAPQFVEVFSTLPGDIAAMATTDAQVPNHLFILLDKNSVLNTDRFVGVHRTRLFPLSSKVMNYYRCKDLQLDGYDPREIDCI